MCNSVIGGVGDGHELTCWSASVLDLEEEVAWQPNFCLSEDSPAACMPEMNRVDVKVSASLLVARVIKHDDLLPKISELKQSPFKSF